MNPINEKIRELRKNKNLTQDALGAKLGISGQAVAKWEKGESMPDIMLLPDLCKILGTSADNLLEVSRPETEAVDLLRMEDPRGLIFELKGTAYRDECMKLSHDDITGYLSVLTNPLTFNVLKVIPYKGDESITRKEICALTGYCETDVDKVIRYLQKRELIGEVNGSDENDAVISFDALDEPRYTQGNSMLGIYMVLAGCMRNHGSKDSVVIRTCQEGDETVTTIIKTHISIDVNETN